MQIETTLLLENKTIIQGLFDGTLKRYGSVIRETNTGRIVGYLCESPGLTKQQQTCSFPSIITENASGASSIIKTVLGNSKPVNANTLGKISVSSLGIEQSLSSILQVSQIAAGASILNLGVSIAGFAYMGYKLNQIQTSLGQMQQSMEKGFNSINERLDLLSGQLAYIHLLVEDSRQKQEHLAQAIANLQRTIFLKEISDLAAETLNHNRFPDTSPMSFLKVASRVRLFLSNQSMQATPELEPETMLNCDLAVQGWVAATAVEANLLLEIGNIQEAKNFLTEEVSKFRDFVFRWSDELISDENPRLATAYRFISPRLKKNISSERVQRIANISTCDFSLSNDRIRRRKNDVEVEFDMSSDSQFDQTWIYRQIAIAEYLDAFSELLARLESLQFFADLCESQNIKSSKNILPDANAESGLYLLCSN